MSPFTTAALIDAVNEEKKIVMIDTSMSVRTIAAAVADVRRGFRVALSRAIRPVSPANFGTGKPMAAVMGPAIRGPTITTPMKREMMPSRIELAVLLLAPVPTPTRRATRKMPPMIQRTGDRLPVSSATSRMAAMGSTREARHDGRNADTIVTTRPTTSDRMMVRGATTGTVDGRSSPTAFRARDQQERQPDAAEQPERASRPRR